MNGVLKETLQQQVILREEYLHKGEDNELAEIVPSLTFTLSGQDFTCKLEEVKEVTEIMAITPYPFKLQGHIGIVNLRGKVTPVVCPLFNEQKVFVAYDENELQKLNREKFRLIVFQEEDGEDFAVIAGDVAKRRSHSKQWGNQDVVNMDGHPYKVFSRDDVKSIYREVK